jgi:hypothetical protein
MTILSAAPSSQPGCRKHDTSTSTVCMYDNGSGPAHSLHSKTGLSAADSHYRSRDWHAVLTACVAGLWSGDQYHNLMLFLQLCQRVGK